jgi:hypothetical protein
MKIFLPFTINLDPYLMKLVKEEVQTLEASKPPDSPRFPPAAHSPYRPVRVSLQQQQAGRAGGEWGDQLMRHIPANFARRKLSELSVSSVCALLTELLEEPEEGEEDGEAQISGHIEAAVRVIRSNHISGRVLAACDLDELRAVLGLNFGDWNLFRLAVLSLRQLDLNGQQLLLPPEDATAGDVERRRRKTAVMAARGPAVSSGGVQARRPRRQVSLEKQVQLEDEAVSSLLARINETAREDIQQEGMGDDGVGCQTLEDRAANCPVAGEDNLDQRTAPPGRGQSCDKEEQQEVSQLVYPTRTVPDLDESSAGPAQLDARRTTGGGSVVFSDAELDSLRRCQGGGRTNSGINAGPRSVVFDIMAAAEGRRASGGPVLMAVQNERLGGSARRGGEGEEGSPYAWLNKMADTEAASVSHSTTRYIKVQSSTESFFSHTYKSLSYF